MKGNFEYCGYSAKGMVVGNRKRTIFWHHRWAIHKPLIELPIEEIWSTKRGWKLKVFADLITADVLNK